MDFLKGTEVKLSANALQRVIARGLGQKIRTEIEKTPLLHMVNSEAHILCSDVDVTKANVAFGRLAIPKMKRELLSSDPMVAKRAFSSLLDMVHDPERAVEAIRLKVVPRLVRPMLSNDMFIKQHTLMILEVLAMQPDGKMDIVQRKNILENISTILNDNDENIRLSGVKTLLAFATSYFGIEELIKNNFISTVIFRLGEENIPEIKHILLDILELMLDLNMDAKLEGLNCGGIKIVELLEYSDERIRSSAAAIVAQFARHPHGKDAILQHNRDILALLTDLLEDSDMTVKTHTAATLMFIMCKTDAKLRCLKLATPVYLLQCAKMSQHPDLQLNAIKALTSLAESPAGQRLLKDNLGLIKSIWSAEDIVRNHKNILLTVINRVI